MPETGSDKVLPFGARGSVAPAVWNSLPEDVRSSTSLPVFRRRLKTELYRRSLGPRHSV